MAVPQLNTNADTHAIEERRRKVWQLRLGGGSERAIAQTLSVSLGTVHNDLQAVIASLRGEQRALAAEYTALHLARTERLLSSLWPRAVNDPGAAGADKKFKTSEQDFAIDRTLALLTHQARLLGLYAPTRVSHEGEGGGPLLVSGTLDARATLTPDEAQRLAQTLTGKLVLLAKNAALYGPSGGGAQSPPPLAEGAEAEADAP